MLRFLQERVIERVGARKEIPVDVRVLCATHKNLQELIREGGFREDLFYRISEIAIRIPPLRERAGDTLLLARAFLERYSRQHGGKMQCFSKDALTALESYAWPGNVRELENRVKRAVIMSDQKQASARDLELANGQQSSSQGFKLREIREQAERQAVIRAMGHVGGKISQAADLLGVSRPTMYDLIKKYNLKN
jgi:two-component system NtrC family response regulator